MKNWNNISEKLPKINKFVFILDIELKSIDRATLNVYCDDKDIVDNEKKLKNGDLLGDYISSHSKEQLQKFKPFLENTLHAIVKINSPWVVYIPDGYSLLSMPIPYNDDVRFTAATGFVKKMSFCNVQLYWHKLNSKELIKKGTPLCQYILVKDEEIDFEISKMTKKDIIHLNKLRKLNNVF